MTSGHGEAHGHDCRKRKCLRTHHSLSEMDPIRRGQHMGREFQRELPQKKLPSLHRTLLRLAGVDRCAVSEICAITGRSPHAVRTATALGRERARDRGMDERAFEEVCKWHEEQATMRRGEAGNLPAAAVAADMHAKTSAALHEAADEIKRLRSGDEPGRGACDQADTTNSGRNVRNIPAPIFWSLAIGQVVFLGWLIFQTLGWL